jgi:hypothetical protein
MSAIQDDAKTTKRHRLHALCPYFAMFPESFAREAIVSLSRPGDVVFDPFCGRGTAVLEALLVGRMGIGCDINPVAALVSQAKANPPHLGSLVSRIDRIESDYRKARKKRIETEAAALPVFFRHAFAQETLSQLLYVRRVLGRSNGPTDRFLRALILGHLHGECDRSSAYLSNQMPRTISPKPAYSVRYWQERGLIPPKRDLFSLMREKAVFRLRDCPPGQSGKVQNCDVRNAAPRMRRYSQSVSLVVTSPPYFDTTNFEEDQWLRLWFLGGEPHPTYRSVSKDDRYTNVDAYFSFLAEAWSGIGPLLKPGCTIVCRIGAKSLSLPLMTKCLDESFHQGLHKVARQGEPAVTGLKNRQTNAFHPGTIGCKVEYDYRYVLKA